MSTEPSRMEPAGPVLLCFDGSEDAAEAIAVAGRALSERKAVVATAWEPVASWAPYDPTTILSAPLSRLVSNALDLDDIVRDLAREWMQLGVELASEAGFQAEGRTLAGKPWKSICEGADSLDAQTIVLGARGMGRVESALLGSVSSAVIVHAERPVLVIPHHKHDPHSSAPRGSPDGGNRR